MPENGDLKICAREFYLITRKTFEELTFDARNQCFQQGSDGGERRGDMVVLFGFHIRIRLHCGEGIVKKRKLRGEKVEALYREKEHHRNLKDEIGCQLNALPRLDSLLATVLHMPLRA